VCLGAPQAESELELAPSIPAFAYSSQPARV
jgi:hypothetical protein